MILFPFVVHEKYIIYDVLTWILFPLGPMSNVPVTCQVGNKIASASASLCLSLTQTHAFSLSLSLSVSHTHTQSDTHTLSLSHSLSLTHTYTLSLSHTHTLSLSHTHSRLGLSKAQVFRHGCLSGWIRLLSSLFTLTLGSSLGCGRWPE